ncbi:hypothetical protein PBI_MCFLY_95 [Mycobacterium phage McFly]|uniref:Uncharacterized protein n=7 Tax=Caudoviricetes TaxID=2731619 RepID=A0A2U8UQ46_9CAUD|nr:hypothetical protein AXJ19_gp017 [Mycobacterium phage VohminGhazi]YP_009637897.1 hypothetical protein FGG32_gp016 [Mycobacterium phage EricB]YP_010061220.1 hypothetical protein KIP54_gp16 [Mycobacterium phage JewelBug]YP_010061319.1 hypothetical protein KIP55_gp015 [Mycobacterium phage Priamo]AEK08536.1 hypothetical protein PBI_DAVINCI_93 [Mycobacterium phage DaVinci]AMQ66929.1 hypothetical protein PBI_MCFLY_95 [Mycobacterium phage McFly]AMW64444.1 hypothetical protein PBI_KAZAN_96 [Mycoba
MLCEVWMDTKTGPAFLVGMLSNAQAETLVKNLRVEGIFAWIS